MTSEESTSLLKCYCGKPVTIYSGLFERSFCSEACVENLRQFFGDINVVTNIVEKAKIHGDFKIYGATVTLANYTQRSKTVIDLIDSQIQTEIDKANEFAKQRKELKKIGLDDQTIEAMLKAKG